MTFFIAGGYSCGNPGDEAILKTTVYRLQELYPGARFILWTDSKDFQPEFDREVDHEIFYWKPMRWRRSQSFVSLAATKLYIDLYPASKWVLGFQAFFNSRAMKALKSADRVVFVGGGYINSDFCLPEMDYIATIARWLGKKVVMLGQTLGPFRQGQHQRIADALFKKADKIVLRDLESIREVPNFMEKVWQSTDDAITFEPRLSSQDKETVARYFPARPTGALTIGLNLRDWKDSRHYYPAIARALASFEKSSGKKIHILFVPMETSAFCDDRQEAREFARHLPPGMSFASVNEPLSVEQTHALIAKLDILIAMRLHAMVFALSSGVPAIGLYEGEYYFRKISGLFESFRVEKNLLPFDRLEELEGLLHSITSDAGEGRAELLENRARIVENQKDIFERLLAPKGQTA